MSSRLDCVLLYFDSDLSVKHSCVLKSVIVRVAGKINNAGLNAA